MAYQIRVSPNALREASARQREIGDRVTDIYVDVNSLTRWLDGAWDGNASEQAIAGLKQMQVYLKKIVNYIEESAYRLNEIAQVFENADGPIGRVGSLSPLGLGRVDLDFGFGFGSANVVRISTDEVRTVAKHIDQEGEALHHVSSMLQSHLRGLENEWEGRAFQCFCQDQGELIDAIEYLSKEIEEFSRRIYAAAMRYEEIDNSL